MLYTVKKEMPLLDFLMIHYNRKLAKTYLHYKQVSVNQKTVSQFDYILQVGDKVEVSKERKEATPFTILYEDKDYIVIDKPAGLLSMASGKEKEKTAYRMVGEYLRRQDRQAKVFIVHRLDRDTSGVLLFAKNENSKRILQEQWNDITYKRGYIAVVEGHFTKKEGTIKNYLSESKTQKVYISKNDGKLAITHYKVIKENKYFSLVEIYLDTGRKNQIRVHMESLGHSIVGDRKYGATSSPIKRLGLHAHAFGVIHPLTKKKMEWEAPIPESFTKLF